MTEERFWQIVEGSRQAARGPREGFMERQAAAVEAALGAACRDEVRGFDRHFAQLKADAYRWDLWAAAYIMLGGCSDDSFMDFRSWLISMGPRVYQDALRDVETLAVLAEDAYVEDYCFEELAYVAWQLLGEDEDEDEDDGADDPASPSEPAGRPWEEDDLPALYPALWARYGDQ